MGLPNLYHPTFDINAIILIAPVAFILVAKNLGHIKAVEAMIGQAVSPYMGRVGRWLCTAMSSSMGGTGVITYAEDIDVMAVTKVYSTTIFVVAGLIAVLLGLSPKFGAIIHTIPGPLLGGASIVVFGLITVSGVKIWLDNKIDFSKNSNLIIAAVTIIMGAGDFSLHIGQLNLGGIGIATLVAIMLNALFSRNELSPSTSRTDASHLKILK